MYRKLIMFALLLLPGTLLCAQEEVVFDTVFLSKQHNSFFKQHPSVKEIIFQSGKKEMQRVRIVSRNHLDLKDSYYDLTFEGDLYLLAKAYGVIER